MQENVHIASMMRTIDAAAFVGLSASTLTKLRLTGGGPLYLKLGKTVVYDRSDLKNWLDSKRRRSTSAI
ncbi:helix-turn-helix transcriptional regulator [Agrobacterium pusense]|uniref:helix-turn-helix transcriptional regulator n=1 Tax=Agrobacterium pusense TaxID=648995 RepID=UPI0028A2A0CE|nr:helix-turn-helix domain-containing protein [Agrobacterium pusense]